MWLWNVGLMRHENPIALPERPLSAQPVSQLNNVGLDKESRSAIFPPYQKHKRRIIDIAHTLLHWSVTQFLKSPI